MEQIRIDAFVHDKLNNLVKVLYEEGYFGFIDSAIAYVDDIYGFIYSIPAQRHKKTVNNKLGEWYCKYKPNRNTTWFVTFDTENDLYLIKNITNNHSKDYPDFIKGAV